MEKQFLYLKVVEKLEELIASGYFKSGTKLPSIRKISSELNISLTTAKQAYAILIAKGLIFVKDRSGYYINATNKDISLAKVERFSTLSEKVEVNQMATKMLKNAQNYVIGNFSILSPAPENLPINALNKKVREALNEPTNFSFSYPLIDGHPNLIAQLSRFSLKWEHIIPTDEFIITNGCMEAINLCLEAVTNPGDLVIVESPSYLGLFQSIERFGLKVLEIPLDPLTGGINLDLLKDEVNKNKIAACLLMPRMNNPTGTFMPNDIKQKLVEFLAERQIPLIEDDALGEIDYTNGSNLPAKAFDKTGNVMYCSSFSKTLSPGFRIGWVAGGRYIEKIKKIKYSTNISTNAIFQYAIANYLESGLYPKHIKKLTLDTQLNMVKYFEAIKRYFPTTCKIIQPDGGYSFWIELPENIDGIHLQRAALQQKIGICPGQIFTMNPYYHHYIRLNYCNLFTYKIEQYLKKLGKIIENLTENY